MDDNSVEYLDQRNKIVFKQGKVDAEEIFHMAQLKTLLNVRTQHKDQEIGSCPLTSHICIKSCSLTSKSERKGKKQQGVGCGSAGVCRCCFVSVQSGYASQYSFSFYGSMS